MTDAPHPVESPRTTAVRIIAAWLKSGAFPSRMLEDIAMDRAWLTETVLGVVRRYGTLRWLLRRYTKHLPEGVAEAAVYVGWYELLFMEHTAPYAAVNEAVEATRALGAAQATGLVNALLRKAALEREHWRRDLDAQPPPVRLSHPPTLFSRWARQWGQRDAIRLCQWNNEPAETFIRPRTTLADYLKRLQAEGIQAEPHPFDPIRFLRLPRGVAPRTLPGYAEGLFYVQDPATAIAVDLLDPHPGETVLDACAAPGGKTLLMADRLAGRGRLVACDLHEDRLTRLRENLARSGHADVALCCADFSAWSDDILRRLMPDGRRFDAILLDVPCTNTGVIRRRPEVRWTFSAARLERITAIQQRLLDAAARLVAPTGRIVYSTCSLEPEEDEGMIQRWLHDHPDWQAVRARKLFPPNSGTDGVYAVLLKRRQGEKSVASPAGTVSL